MDHHKTGCHCSTIDLALDEEGQFILKKKFGRTRWSKQGSHFPFTNKEKRQPIFEAQHGSAVLVAQ
jgi:hypothetical protein